LRAYSYLSSPRAATRSRAFVPPASKENLENVDLG
jgi:hypothetical protein